MMFLCLNRYALFHVPPLYRQKGNKVIHETLLDYVGVLESSGFTKGTLSNQSFQVSERYVNSDQRYDPESPFSPTVYMEFF